MTVFRIHIRPTGGLGDKKLSFDYCIKAQVLGLGWQTYSQKSGITWEQYVEDAKEVHGETNLSRVKYIKDNVKPNDLIWTRDLEGIYFLAKVESGWEYLSSPLAQDADITNVIKCRIYKVASIDNVPGKVIACFRPSRAIQRITDMTVVDYSKFLWNKLSRSNDYKLKEQGPRNIFSFLNSEETEDIIFIYLQTRGWVVIPHSRKADTMRYEFYLINKTNKKKAKVQVKTGNTPIPSDWKEWDETPILFQSNGIYHDSYGKNVECIDPKEIEDFIYGNPDLIPGSIMHWADVAREIK